MKVEATYRDGLAFEVTMGKHTATMDTKAPLGKDSGPSPKEFLLGSIICCSGMDIVALCKKFKILLTNFGMSATGNPRNEHPRIFPTIDVTYEFEGSEIDAAKIIEIVHLSMDKYCGVSAMVAPTSPIHFKILINGEQVHEAIKSTNLDSNAGTSRN